ncbi:ATP-dependent zinc protease [Ferrimonas gelatinilytica]|uniref:ATP-dependent zinc protease n=1 Tax=Ferrimonas gelatinilytica TaxID=1255257 RepID=A0ABP9SE56_9GAMM
MESVKSKTLQRAGWREWVGLPQLGIPRIKAKLDSGARTSCLHAFETEEVERDGVRWLRFKVHPHQNDLDTVVVCEAPLLEQRKVTDSGGHVEWRPVIQTELVMAGQRWPIEMTVTNRDTMKFRMLIGRTAMKGRLLIDSDASFLLNLEP